MADDFAERFQFGLSDLPAEPDDFNPLRPPGGPASMGTPPVVAAGFRLPIRRPAPVGPYPGPRWPAPKIPIPEWWKALGPALEVLRRIGEDGFGGSGGGGAKEDPDCDEHWNEARRFCAEELRKPFPSRNATGGHTNVYDCSKGRVPERCGGNAVSKNQPPKRQTHWTFD